MFPEPSLLQAEQPQLSQPVLTGEVLQPSNHFCGPLWLHSQQLHVCPVLRAPELDAGLWVGSHQSRAEGQNPLPRPAGHAAGDAAHDTVGFQGCKCTVQGHVELLVNQHPQVLLLRAALYNQVYCKGPGSVLYNKPLVFFLHSGWEESSRASLYF